MDDQVVAAAVDTQTIVVHSATLPDGGFIAIIDDFSSEILGVSFYLEAGTHENVAIALDTYIELATDVFAQIHRDTDEDLRFDFDGSGDPDRPYTSDGSPVRDSAVVSVQAAAVRTHE